MKRKKTENYWASFSDLMTALMVIFMFIAIAYMLEVQKRQKKLEEQAETLAKQKEAQEQLFTDYADSKTMLYEELKQAFKEDFKRWSIELDQDLSIKFTNPEVLFASNSAVISPQFQEILNEFLPRYLEIILADKYKDKISEIRIEGHTDTLPTRTSNDPYIGNLSLSQNRAAAVLAYLRALPSFQNLSAQKQKKLQFWFTANGLSYGRTLDRAKKLTLISGEPVDNNLSRRVEFKIVTSSGELIKQIIQEMQKQ